MWGAAGIYPFLKVNGRMRILFSIDQFLEVMRWILVNVAIVLLEDMRKSDFLPQGIYVGDRLWAFGALEKLEGSI